MYEDIRLVRPPGTVGHKTGRGSPKNFKDEQLKLGLKSAKECL